MKLNVMLCFASHRPECHAVLRRLVVQVHPDHLEVEEVANLLTRLVNEAREALCGCH